MSRYSQRLRGYDPEYGENYNAERYEGQRLRRTERTKSNINKTADRLIKAAGSNAARVSRINEIRNRYLTDVPPDGSRVYGRTIGARTSDMALSERRRRLEDAARNEYKAQTAAKGNAVH